MRRFRNLRPTGRELAGPLRQACSIRPREDADIHRRHPLSCRLGEDCVGRFSVFLRGCRFGRRDTRFQRPPGPPLLFVHIAKTAGTSFRRTLEAALGTNAVWPADEDLRRRPDGVYPSEAEILGSWSSMRPYFCLTGHFFASFVDRLPVRHRTAVFLRDPVERSLSTLAHFRHTTGIPPHRLLDDAEFVSRHVRNHQTIILGHDGDSLPPDCDARIFEKALGVIDTFDFVGITERFRESCLLFDSVFATGIEKACRRENVMRPNGTEFSELIPRILPLVEVDRELYAHAMARFQSDHRRIRTFATPLRRAS